MFNITSNQIIKIHKGDCSGALPLFLNQGTNLEPIQYKFYSDCSILDKAKHLNPVLYKTTFFQATAIDGIYDFEYNYKYNLQGQIVGALGWYLNAGTTPVILSTYGITLAEVPNIGDHITILRLKDHTSEIYFYILYEGMPVENAFVTKTFKTNGIITTAYANSCLPTITKEVDNLIDENHNVILFLDSDDTKYLKPGEYCYQIRVKLVDLKSPVPVINTVTNQLPFIVASALDTSILPTLDSINELNTIYGKLNQKAKAIEYTGGTTNSTTVHINDHVITVDAQVNVEQLNKLENQYKNIKDAQTITSQNITELYSTIRTLNTRIDTLQTTILELSNKFPPIDAKLINLDERVTALERLDN